MLPYRLRAPIYGKQSEDIKKRNAGDDISKGGGPVQRAIEQDLKEFQTLFVTKLSAYQQQHTHWKAGIAFGIFKECFQASKIAVLHWMVIPPRCDREAFSQLIYSACWETFRQALQQHKPLETIAATLFCLYTLWETNPLPATTKSPWEHLPLALYDLENPRNLYRRAYRQLIRIDPQHYRWLLETRCVAQARQAECRQAH